jgi:dihydroneopterin aldolase/2-amino-4-hydroxy-6-hydroxymethyldihydropteridine diphosphokinase/dihydropteroate synthase
VVYIAVGSNLGDRVNNIQKSLDLLSSFCIVTETAFLYETPPAYVLDQPSFLNTAVRVRR